MNALLPLWIIGAPLIVAIVDRFMSPAVGHNHYETDATRTTRTTPAGTASRAL